MLHKLGAFMYALYAFYSKYLPIYHKKSQKFAEKRKKLLKMIFITLISSSLGFYLTYFMGRRIVNIFNFFKLYNF
jgi:hypothetical protein